MASLNARVTKLEETATPKRTFFVVVEEEGVNPLPAYLIQHPENAGSNILVIDTGIYRPRGTA
ncbi:hypothetical protein [Solidesulfovibrio alcoholivorans]|uniref:hypothetical protein n=1 Tax=Solidesulfovibrio alcoholivorans TaxID=81406 RepID=UPI0005C24C26|nr:hypothetical protein [Solidesulfovibrio alcoholivorans]